MIRAALFAALAAYAHAAVAKDLVTSLPNYGPPPTTWYSGYLDIPGGKHLHYILIESPNPTTDPLTAWLCVTRSRDAFRRARPNSPVPPRRRQ